MSTLYHLPCHSTSLYTSRCDEMTSTLNTVSLLFASQLLTMTDIPCPHAVLMLVARVLRVGAELDIKSNYFTNGIYGFDTLCR